ncbi:MAG: potassium channel beta subunit family protein [Opitutales bacterium]
MIYRHLGSSGLEVSVLSYGAWVTFAKQLDVRAAAELMKTAYDAGVNFFDNAEGYEGGRAEEVMGAALAEMGWRRSTWCVSSKVFWGGGRPNEKGLSRKHVMECCHAALKRLRVDYLDLYFCHRPDIATPIEETVETMTTLIRQGKVLYWGTSEWNSQQITQAHLVARERNLIGPTMEQPQYNLMHRQRVEVEYGPLYQNFGLGTTIWSPLASGLLTGKYNDGIPEDSRLNLPGYEWLRSRLEGDEGPKVIKLCQQLQGVADELGISLTRLALAWCAKNEQVSTVILGATKIPQLEENLKAVDDLEKLTPDVMARIAEITSDYASSPEPTFGR